MADLRFFLNIHELKNTVAMTERQRQNLKLLFIHVIDETAQEQNNLKLLREVKKLQKENQKQKQELEASNKRERKLQEHRRNYEEDYYTEKGREAPESEDEELDGSLAQDQSQHDQSDDSLRSPSPMRKSFPTSVNVVNVITASPPQTIRKSTSRAAISILNTQRPSEGASSGSSGNSAPPTVARGTPASPMTPTIAVDSGNGETPADTPPVEQEYPDHRRLQLREGQQGDRLSHYVGQSKLLVRKALKRYEGAVMSYDMQPTAEVNTREEWADLIWSKLMEELDEGDLPFRLSNEVIKLMAQRETRIRCAAWDRLKPIVESAYAFNHGSSVDIKKKNIELHNLLVTNFGFYFKNPEERKGYMQTPVIVEGISRILFYNKKAYGIVMESDFNPIPVNFIAFMFSLIENYINHWSTGLYSSQELDVDVLGMGGYQQGEGSTALKTLVSPRPYAGVASTNVIKEVPGLTPKEREQVAAELENMDIPDSEDDELGSAVEDGVAVEDGSAVGDGVAVEDGSLSMSEEGIYFPIRY
ncbi:hypothetical protein F5880DRAFT_1617797 [Lentinula raphanica]|nr:hypothetical protein F5880DRAFT_1617797 [Lentinula raphanica]